MEEARPGEPLYLRSMDAAYLRAFEAEVLTLPPEGVVLSKTLFYAVGGGQEADHGSLTSEGGDSVKVVDVRRMSGVTVHRLTRGGAATFRTGIHVHGEIDWDRRYTNMRLHTAQHLLSALVFKKYGLKTRRAAMAGRGGHLDLDGPIPGSASIAELQGEANERYFNRSVPVNIRFVSKEEFATMPGRSSGKSLPPSVTDVRLIIIEGIDTCPCGGTHVRNTQEVKGVTIKPPVPYQDGAHRLAFDLISDR
jgi:misacylated tRNA(Ala) deacylase